MPRVWNVFFGSFSRLRPIQLEAMPLICSGANVLVTAPTAGGKTEAAVAPICERLLSQRWSGLSVILVTPTRALVNDLYERLSRPMLELRIRLARKTSDHPLSQHAADQFLVTTPESVESLLTFAKSRLQSVRAIILDEIHLLDGASRGDQLRVVLNRLTALRASSISSSGVQRIAMSATVADPDRLATAYLGRDRRIISVPGQRLISSAVVVAPGDPDQRASAAVAAMEATPDCRKVLVFVNSRKQADAAKLFSRGAFVRAPVYGHHGSLSKDHREEVELRFRTDEKAICVATMTLEVGIDIGDVDLVVCMDPPFSLSSFLQRIGRGCRRMQGLTRVVGVARNQGGRLMFEALIAQASMGVPKGPVMGFRRSVLVQQALAYLQQSDRKQRTRHQFAKVLESCAAPMIFENVVSEVLSDMVETGLLVERAGIYEPSALGREIIESNRIYSNMPAAPTGFAVVDTESGRTIANIDGVQGDGRSVLVAGREYTLVKGAGRGVVLVRPGGTGGESPRYHTQKLPYAFDVGVALRNRLGIRAEQIAVLDLGDRKAAFTWLGSLYNKAIEVILRRRGVEVTGGCFALIIAGVEPASLIEIIRLAVAEIDALDLRSQLRIDQIVDLGSFFEDLSPGQQSLASREAFDLDFLRSWAGALAGVESITPASSRFVDALELAGVE